MVWTPMVIKKKTIKIVELSKIENYRWGDKGNVYKNRGK